jgi:hypothetical protein
MMSAVVENTENKGRRRRSSYHKGSKEWFERRRRVKNVLLWVLIMVIGIAVVAVIAVLTGQGVG